MFHKKEESIGKKTLLSIAGLTLGVLFGVGVSVLLEKKEEKKVGGKLMDVHYRFTKNFED